MLHRRGDHMPPPLAHSGQRGGHRPIVRLGAAGGEKHPVRLRAQGLGHLLPGSLQPPGRIHAKAVQGAGVAPPRLQSLLHICEDGIRGESVLQAIPGATHSLRRPPNGIGLPGIGEDRAIAEGSRTKQSLQHRRQGLQPCPVLG